MKKITNLNIFETNVFDGPMQLKYDYFPEITEGASRKKITPEMAEEIEEEFLKIRTDAGIKYGFDGTKIIVPSDKDSLKTGDYFVADETVYSMDDDLWNVDIPGDIVILKENNPGIAVAYPVADDPVIIIEDKEKGATALSHCSIEKISKKMPILTVKALEKEMDSEVENLKVYIGTHLKKESNVSIKKPKAISKNKEIWKKCVTRKSDNKSIKKVRKIDSGLGHLIFNIIDKISYRIDAEKAIINMLVKYGINPDNITVSPRNSFDDIRYYSDKKVNMYKEDLLKGKFLVGAYYSNTFEELDNKCPYTGRQLTRHL